MSKFCSSCGTALAAGSGFCSSCGSPVANAAAPTPQPTPQNIPQQPAQYVPIVPKLKSKTTAILLAIFFGQWAWLYTFKRDKAKFFIGAGVGFVAYVVALVSYLLNFGVQQQLIDCYTTALLYNTIDLSFCEIYKPNFIGVWIGGAIGWGIWLWAVIDTARKKNDYFTSYPNAR